MVASRHVCDYRSSQFWQTWLLIVSLARPIPLQARGRVWGNACIEFVHAPIFLINDVLKYHMIIINNYFIMSKLHVYSRAILFYYFNIFPSHVIVIVRAYLKLSDLIGTHAFLRQETNSMQAFPQTLPLACSGMGLASETRLLTRTMWPSIL